jgi:hypothetical protein
MILWERCSLPCNLPKCNIIGPLVAEFVATSGQLFYLKSSGEIRWSWKEMRYQVV